MRFKNYLNERDEKVISAIQPFLREFGDAYEKDLFIGRGVMGLRTKTYTYKKTRKDRKPRFVDEELHKFLGKLSKELGGWNIRTEGVFTADKFTASSFGDGRTYIFIPSGEYTYVGTRAKDAVYGLYDQFTSLTDTNMRKEVMEKLESLYRYDYYTSLLPKYLSPGRNEFEAIFNCNNYFMIEQRYGYEKFKDKIGG